MTEIPRAVIGVDSPVPDSSTAARKAEKKARKKASKQTEQRRRAMDARRRGK